MREPALEDYENYLKENGVSITQDDGLQRFQNGELAYLVTDVHGYRVIQSAQKNFLVKPLALSSDHLIGRFTDEWSVNKRAGSAEKEAAKVLLSYWLSEGAQVNLHAVYGSAGPVNDKQRKKLLEDVYSDLTEISKQSEKSDVCGRKAGNGRCGENTEVDSRRGRTMRRCLGCMQLFSEEYQVCPHCGCIVGQEQMEAFHLKPGTVLKGRYLIGRALGYGGFGVTYRAWDLGAGPVRWR